MLLKSNSITTHHIIVCFSQTKLELWRDFGSMREDCRTVISSSGASLISECCGMAEPWVCISWSVMSPKPFTQTCGHTVFTKHVCWSQLLVFPYTNKTVHLRPLSSCKSSSSFLLFWFVPIPGRISFFSFFFFFSSPDNDVKRNLAQRNLDCEPTGPTGRWKAYN